MARIARAAGVNKQLIFYYFQSKVGLFRAAVESAAEGLVMPRRTGGQATRLRDALSEVLGELADRPDDVGLLLQAIASHEVASPLVVRLVGRPLAQIRDIVSQGQGTGVVRDDVDPDLAALQMTVLLLGYLALEPVIAQTGSTVTRAAWLAAVADVAMRTVSW